MCPNDAQNMSNFFSFSFVFFGEVRKTQIAFEIIWPLSKLLGKPDYKQVVYIQMYSVVVLAIHIV